MKVKIVNKSNNPLPDYSTKSSAGMDLRAYLTEPLILKPMQREVVPTGIFLELPMGVEAQIRPRSGLASKHGVTVLNTPGTIDSDYRGEIKIIIVNLSDSEFKIENGERIAQMVVARYEHVELNEVVELGESARGVGGFGHTGKI